MKMKNVLVVDDEKPFVLSLKAGMERHCPDFNVLTAEHGRAASEILEYTRVDLVVTDLRMPEMDGFELLAHMSTNFPSIPTIVMSAYGTPEVKDRLKNMGSLRFIDKPVDFDELGQAIIDGLEKAPGGGTVMGISICGFLQLIEMEQKTCLLEVQQEDRNENGFFYFNRGNLYDATCGDMKGQEAALEIIGWDNARIAFKNLPKEKLTRRINAELMGLIMEGLRRKDQATALEEDKAGEVKIHEQNNNTVEKAKPEQKKKQTVPFRNREEIDALMSQAVRSAQGHHFEQARKLLSTVLKSNARRIDAWLLLSRVSDDFATVEWCLGEAHRHAPDDPVVFREISTLKALRHKYSGTEKLRRCPFCWHLLEAGFSYCRSCKAFLRVEGTFLAVRKYADKDVLKGAIKRYGRILEREKQNFKACYYLGIAHINLEQWEEGISYLSRAVDLSPKDPDLAEQLDTVLKYLASGDPFGRSKRADTDSQGTGARINGKTVLVVEDSSTTRMVISTTLSKEGYRVMEAGDGLEALSKLDQVRPDLVLLDIILPKMDGYHILGVIKKNRELKRIPVIMLTGKDKFLDKVKGKMSGSSEYLTKPFEPDELLAAVEKYLQG
jgi:twitching motility two-component system response regulator PilG